MVEAVSSNVRELRTPQKGLSSRCHLFANCSSVWIFAFYDSFPVIIATGCEFNTFITLFPPPIAPICDLTNCWGHFGIEATKLANPESSSSSPCPGGPTASRLQAKASNLSCDLLDPDLVLYRIEVPTHSELHAYRKEPNPLTLAFPTPSPGLSHYLPALACALSSTPASTAQSPARWDYPGDALSGKGTQTSWYWRTRLRPLPLRAPASY